MLLECVWEWGWGMIVPTYISQKTDDFFDFHNELGKFMKCDYQNPFNGGLAIPERLD